MRQVRVQGCLPTLAVLVVVAALGAAAFTAGLAVVAITGALLVVAALVRGLRRLLGGAPVAHGPGGGRPGRVEAVPPGWMEREGGPVVEAAPRGTAAAPDEPGAPGEPFRAGERDLPPRA